MYPCPKLLTPLNGAIVCDNAVRGAACQIFCQNPFDFQPLPGLVKIPEKYSCVGTGKWYPTDQVPHCVGKARCDHFLQRNITLKLLFDILEMNTNIDKLQIRLATMLGLGFNVEHSKNNLIC